MNTGNLQINWRTFNWVILGIVVSAILGAVGGVIAVLVLLKLVALG